jgi:hypothetical protein
MFVIAKMKMVALMMASLFAVGLRLPPKFRPVVG